MSHQEPKADLSAQLSSGNGSLSLLSAQSQADGNTSSRGLNISQIQDLIVSVLNVSPWCWSGPLNDTDYARRPPQFWAIWMSELLFSVFSLSYSPAGTNPFHICTDAT